MKLFVDDIRSAPDDTWVVARTVTEAIRFIANYGSQLTEVSLDHDISHQATIGAVSRPFPCGETFEPVAYFIAASFGDPSAAKFSIRLHTSNPAGADKMLDVLLRAGLKAYYQPAGAAANRLEMEV